MQDFMDFVRRALDAEFSTDSGRINYRFGILLLVLLIVSYVPTWCDYLYATAIVIFRPQFPVPEIPQTPPWGVAAFLVYAIVCVAFIGIKLERARRHPPGT